VRGARVDSLSGRWTLAEDEVWRGDDRVERWVGSAGLEWMGHERIVEDQAG
jgi:hypothetical protein